MNKLLCSHQSPLDVTVDVQWSFTVTYPCPDQWSFTLWVYVRPIDHIRTDGSV